LLKLLLIYVIPLELIFDVIVSIEKNNFFPHAIGSGAMAVAGISTTRKDGGKRV
jgi:hypothetical protein